MERGSKVNLGLKKGSEFTIPERIRIVRDYQSSGMTKQAIWYKYTGHKQEHGQILNWMIKYNLGESKTDKRGSLETNEKQMKKHKKVLELTEDAFENLQLKKRILDLERQLKEAELKAIAFSTMVDIAEKEFNIPIRKKFNTKP